MDPEAKLALATVRGILARESNSACLLGADGKIQFVNEAWDRFARENGGAPSALGAAVVGTSWLDHVVGDEVRRHYARILERTLEGQGWGGVVHVGECNSPTEARLVVSRFERLLPERRGAPIGIAAVYTVLTTRPIAEAYSTAVAPEAAYRKRDGLIAQCACCRRVQSPSDPSRWDLVPDLLRTRARSVTHVLCGLCASLYYQV